MFSFVNTYTYTFSFSHTCIHTAASYLKTSDFSFFFLTHMYSHHLIVAFLEPCNQHGEGGEEKTTIIERSAVTLWTGPLLSASIIMPIPSHTQSSFYVFPFQSLDQWAQGNMEKSDGSPKQAFIFRKVLSLLLFKNEKLVNMSKIYQPEPKKI